MNSGSRSLIERRRGGEELLGGNEGMVRHPATETAKFDYRRQGRSIPPHATSEPTTWFCLFRCAAGPIAISLESVAEVLETDRVVRLAWSPPQVIGLCTYHQEVVPVVRLEPPPQSDLDHIQADHNPEASAERSKEKTGLGDASRYVVLMMKSEHGAWGIRVDSQSTLMSREIPEYHAPEMCAHGPVLIGNVRRAETCYRILDAEATWRGLRSVLVRWSGLISEFSDSSSRHSTEHPISAGSGAPANTGNPEDS
jgi:chemotaxis signal transduction protein